MSEGGMSVIEFANDLNEQEAPEPLPIGEYPAEITGAAVKTSATSGNNYLAIQFKISPDHYPADFETGNPDGETLTYNRLTVGTTPREQWRMKKFLEAVGAKLGRTLDPNDLMGLTAMVGITHQDYEGEKRAQISKISGV